MSAAAVGSSGCGPWSGSGVHATADRRLGTARAIEEARSVPGREGPCPVNACAAVPHWRLHSEGSGPDRHEWLGAAPVPPGGDAERTCLARIGTLVI